MTEVKDWTSRTPQEAADFHAMHFIAPDPRPRPSEYDERDDYESEETED